MIAESCSKGHREAASAFYFLVLTVIGTFFLYVLLSHPTDGESQRSTKALLKKKKRVKSRSAPPPQSARTNAMPKQEVEVEGCVGDASRLSQRPVDAVIDPTADESLTADQAAFLRSKILPDSTAAERRRFLAARDGDVEAAKAMLHHYLDWRAQHVVDDEGLKRENGEGETEYQWRCACVTAAKALSEDPQSALPCLLYWVEDEKSTRMLSLGGRKVLQFLPAQIDLSVASGHMYALALALFLEQTLDRNSMEKFCIVIDTRPGQGWGNVPALKLIPFIKHAAALLNNLYPERMAQCVLFPVPVWAKGIWSMVKPFLDPDTANKICLLSGSDKMNAPPPSDMTKYFEEVVVERMEQKRKGCFVDVKAQK